MINRMRETRERNGYSLEEVSSIVRCSPKTLSNYESGKTEKIPYHIVVKLAKPELFTTLPRMWLKAT